jgi:hypothetical protein
MIYALLVPWACTSSAGDSADTDTTSGWSGLEPPAWELESTPEELVAGLETLLVDGVPSPGPVREHYRELMENGDEAANGCPGNAYTLDDDVVRGCTAESGWFYSGISTWTESEGDGFARWSFTGDLWITSPEDLTYTVAGDATWHQDQLGVSGELKGSYQSELVDGWIGAGTSADLIFAANDYELTLDGVLGISGVSVNLTEVVWTEDCVQGTIAVRDASALWVTWVLDCSGCGPVTLDDEVVDDEVCFDLMPYREDLLESLGAA